MTTSGSLTTLLGRARRDAGLSQRDLAALLGRSQSWISKVESGASPVTPEDMSRWTRQCGFQVEGVLVPRAEDGGTALSGPATLRFQDEPLDVVQLAAFLRLAPHVRLRRTLRTLQARGRPLGGRSPDAVLALLRLRAHADPGLALAGAVAAACWTPDLDDHPGLAEVRTERANGAELPIRLGRRRGSAVVGLPDSAGLCARGWSDRPLARVEAARRWLATRPIPWRGTPFARAAGSGAGPDP